MPNRPTFPGAEDPTLEHLRLGTRDQYQSEWRSIANGASHAFTHELGELPWMVDVIRSETSDGKNPVDSNSDVTVAKTDTTITVTNNFGSARYFRVRAM